jgi:hypothetical protein
MLTWMHLSAFYATTGRSSADVGYWHFVGTLKGLAARPEEDIP